MKNLLSVILLVGLVACGGAGSSTTTPPTSNPTATPLKYSIALSWQPAAAVGLSGFNRHRNTTHFSGAGQSGTIVVGSSNGGASQFDLSDPAIVTAQVSPMPTGSPVVTFDSASNQATIDATPTPNTTPNPISSPSVVVVAASPNVAMSTTLTATYGSTSVSSTLVIVQSLALVAMRSGSPVSPDAIGFTFDSSCNAQPQVLAASSDIYLTGPDSATLNFPYGGNTLVNGYDITTLTSASYTGAITSVTLDALAAGLNDTVVFKRSTGQIAYLYLNSYGGSGASSAVASISANYGCLN